MNMNKTYWATVDEAGRLVLPDELIIQFGIKPGDQIRIDEEMHRLSVHRPIRHLAKIYVEPTNYCNLNCRTCIRNNWNVEMGKMSGQTFERILEDAQKIFPPPMVFFGGLGEPLFHRDTVDMVHQMKEIGCRVELITNATLLDDKKTKGLISAGLDTLWVSIDGARPESYADVRLGATLPNVMKNVMHFNRVRPPAHRPIPEIGIVFVAMKRNIADLPEVLAIGRRLRAKRFIVSNLIPHTEEMEKEILYQRTIRNIAYLPSPWLPKLSIPKMDLNDITSDAFIHSLNSGNTITFIGNNLGKANDVCSFVESGSITIGWNGNISPCIPLLYEHTIYLNHYERISRPHIL